MNHKHVRRAGKFLYLGWPVLLVYAIVVLTFVARL